MQTASPPRNVTWLSTIRLPVWLVTGGSPVVTTARRAGAERIEVGPGTRGERHALARLREEATVTDALPQPRRHPRTARRARAGWRWPSAVVLGGGLAGRDAGLEPRNAGGEVFAHTTAPHDRAARLGSHDRGRRQRHPAARPLGQLSTGAAHRRLTPLHGGA